jgi:membrane fusion protein, multidrug efflux system
MRGRVRILLYTIVIGSVLLFISSCAREESTQVTWDELSAATDYTQVVASAADVVVAPLRDRVIGSGTIQGREEAVLKARAGGVIESIDFSLGDTLEKNQVVMTIDDTVAKLTVSQLENQYQNSLKDIEASEKLFERGALSLAQLTQARAALDGLKAQLQLAQDSLANTQVITPIAGRVAERNGQLVVGDLIQPGQQIGRVVDLDKLRVTLPVGQSQLFLIREGYEARIDIVTPTEIISTTGFVSAISASSDSRTGSWSVLVDFDNPRTDIIRAGISAEVTIFNRDAPLYTLVPNAAMVYRDDLNYIYMVEGTNARLVEVAVVDQYGDYTAIQSKEATVELRDQRVLVSGLSRILDGDSIITVRY